MVQSLQFLVRQSEFISAPFFFSFFYIQIAFRNLTAIIHESSAKFFTVISGCDYRNYLKVTQSFFPAQMDRGGSETSSGSDCGAFAFYLTATKKSTD